VALSTKTIDQKEYQTIARTVLPVTAFWSSLSAARYQFDLQANKIREYFGYNPTFDADATRVRNRVERATRSKAGGAASLPKQDMPAQPAGQTSKNSDKGEPPAEPGHSQKPDSSNPPSADQKKVGLPKLPSLTPQGEDKPITLMLFLESMAKNAKPFQIDPPRGTILVTGRIEVVGSKGRATVDASAAYDPKANDFVISSWHPLRFQPKAQSPRGGG
jgi:hypothetical protein